MRRCALCGDETDLLPDGIPTCLKCYFAGNSRNKIKDILEAELKQAKIDYDDARRGFETSVCEIPSGLPGPDGTQRLINAGKKYRSTMAAYARVQRELDHFIVTGNIPQRLKNRHRAGGAGSSGEQT